MKERAIQTTDQEEALLALLDDSDFGRLEAQFNQFCPFEALGIVRAEIRHGNFLAYLFDPSQPHGFGKHGLQALLTSIAKTPFDGPSRISLEMVARLDFDEAEIRREWHNIDILVVFPGSQFVVTVELKIDSSQHGDQLRRYRRRVEHTWPESQGWKHIYVFLTKNKEDADDSGYWVPLNLLSIANEIDAIEPTIYNEAPAGEFIRSYINMLRKHHLKNEKLSEIASILWSRHQNALEYLVDNRPDSVSKLFDLFSERRAEIEIAMRKRGLSVEFDSTTERIVRFAYRDWDRIPEFRTEKEWKSKRLMLLEIIRDKERIRICLTLGRSGSNTRSALAQALSLKPIKGWIFLAEHELFRTNFEEINDIDSACKDMIERVCDFVSQSFAHFNPLIAQIGLLPHSGGQSIELPAIQEAP